MQVRKVYSNQLIFERLDKKPIENNIFSRNKENLKVGIRILKVIDFVANKINFLNWKMFPFAGIMERKTNEFYVKVLKNKNYAHKWKEKYLKNINISNKTIALDFGCGRGRNSAILHNLGIEVYGFEIQAEDWWKALPNNKFIVVPKDYRYLPWESGMFDLVLSSMVLPFFDNSQLEALVIEMARVLKQNGHWLMIEPNKHSFAKNKMHLYYGRIPWSPHEMSEKIEKYFTYQFIRYEKFYSPLLPGFVNGLRNCFSADGNAIMELEDKWERFIPEQKRGLWVMELTKK